MQYGGGLSLIVHLAIIIIAKIKRSVSKILGIPIKIRIPLPHPIIIIALVFFVVGLIGYSLLISSASEYSNLDYISDSTYKCDSFLKTNGPNMVVLRLDDVQAYSYHEEVFAIIKDSFKKNASIVAGVIPDKLNDDKKLISYLRNNNCNLEIAIHGYNHILTGNPTIPEFGNLSEDEAYKKLILGKTILERISKQPIRTFIPPNNLYSAGTSLALKKAGLDIISSEGNNTFDYTVATFDHDKNSLTPINEILLKCQQNFMENKPCIIMIHPQDYETNGKLDSEKYLNFQMLIDKLQENNASFSRFIDIADND